MDNPARLSPTSYLVLGFLEQGGELTPYDLKQRLELSVGNFWSIPQSQLYAEPRRLTAAGYVQERVEKGGRRRRHYKLTTDGRNALAEWREQPTEELPELRDLSLLKLFFGGDPRTIAEAQVEAHEQRLAFYEELRLADEGSGQRGPWIALEAGVGHEQEWVKFWRRLVANE